MDIMDAPKDFILKIGGHLCGVVFLCLFFRLTPFCQGNASPPDPLSAMLCPCAALCCPWGHTPLCSCVGPPMETVHYPGPAVQVRPVNVALIGGCCPHLAPERIKKKQLGGWGHTKKHLQNPDLKPNLGWRLAGLMNTL